MDPGSPPPITIVNPNAPAGEQEVLGSDGGWRPSAYQKGVALLTAAIVALLVTGVQRVRHVHHESALDAAARDGVALTVLSDEESESPEGFRLLSTSTGDVTVLSVALVGDGYREKRQHVTISPQGYGSVEPADARNCSTSLFDRGPDQARVTVRTSRGEVVSRTVPLSADVADMIQQAERWKCHYLLPQEALGAQVVSARRVGPDVVTVWSLLNFGRFPLTVVGLTPAEGLTARASLPVTLERPAFWTGHSVPVRLTVRFRVTDCEAFAAGFRTVYNGLSVPDEIDVLVRHEHGSGVATWSFGFAGFDGEAGLGDRIRPGHAVVLLQQMCDPALFVASEPLY